MSTANHKTSATCTYALRLSDGRFVTDPAGAASYSLEMAYLWLWPVDDTDEVRADRISKVITRHPWMMRVVAVRARS